jgi:hypothetical protein
MNHPDFFFGILNTIDTQHVKGYLTFKLFVYLVSVFVVGQIWGFL